MSTPFEAFWPLGIAALLLTILVLGVNLLHQRGLRRAAETGRDQAVRDHDRVADDLREQERVTAHWLDSAQRERRLKVEAEARAQQATIEAQNATERLDGVIAERDLALSGRLATMRDTREIKLMVTQYEVSMHELRDRNYDGAFTPGFGRTPAHGSPDYYRKIHERLAEGLIADLGKAGYLRLDTYMDERRYMQVLRLSIAAVHPEASSRGYLSPETRVDVDYPSVSDARIIPVPTYR